MTGVKADASTRVLIAGHGITVDRAFTLAPGLTVTPDVPAFDAEAAANGSDGLTDYAAVMTGHPIANFSLVVEDAAGGAKLASKSWNALWQFHLLALACSTPCCSLYSATTSARPLYRSANRNIIVRSFAQVVPANESQLVWARDHHEAFGALIGNPTFSTSMRCYGNAHYLFDLDMRIMLLWSGIEGLLSVDGELNRRLALYAALMLPGTVEDKRAWYDLVKKSYGVRSKAVHGGAAKPDVLEHGYKNASLILVRLLSRCVELGRVPSSAELDGLAVSATVA